MVAKSAEISPVALTIPYDNSDSGSTDENVKEALDTLFLGGGTRIEITVPASATVTADTILMADFQALKYMITGFNQSEQKRKYIEDAILKTSSTTIKSTRSGIITDGVSMTITETVASGTLTLDITNNESFTLTVQLARIKFG